MPQEPNWTPILNEKDRYVGDGVYWVTIEEEGKRFVTCARIHTKLRDKLRPNAIAYIKIGEPESYLPALTDQGSHEAVPSNFRSRDPEAF